MDRYCDQCYLRVPAGSILTSLCIDNVHHNLVDDKPILGIGMLICCYVCCAVLCAAVLCCVVLYCDMRRF